MNFLFISKDFKNGGVEKVFLSYAKHIQDKGDRVEFFILNQEKVPEFQNIEINENNYLKKIISFRSFIKKRKYDKVVVAKESASLFLILSTLFLNVEICFTRHAAVNSSEQKISKHLIGLLYFLYSLKKNSSFFCVSQAIANDLKCYVGKKKLTVISNPIYEKNKFEKLKELEFNDEVYFAAVGRLVELKGFDFLINSYYRALQLDKSLPKLYIIGDGPEFENLSSLIKSFGIDNNIILLGYLADPLPIVSKSSLFILSSRSEGMPTVLVEALMLKVPVLSTDCVSGPNELLGKYGGGILVAVDDEAGMSSGLLNYRNINVITHDNYTRITKDFSVENSLNSLLGLK
jgi:glycosyltransferase involved in cell wall biosynthesis